VDAAIRAGLRPVLCVGETLEERESGRTGEVLHLQVVAALGGLPAADAARVVIAYEPVWAIGTGRNATAEQVVKGHRTIRQALDCPPVPAGVGGTVRVIYGGSVTPGNAAALLAAPGVDGALVGGASLDAAGFAAIVRAAAPVGAARGGK
jgi:triosephosphate isomerase